MTGSSERGKELSHAILCISLAYHLFMFYFDFRGSSWKWLHLASFGATWMRRLDSSCKTVTSASGWMQTLSAPNSCAIWSLASVEFFTTSLLYLLMRTIYVCMHAWMDACAVYMQVGTDLIRPLTQAKEGSEYFVSLMDYFSKWPEADPIPGQDTCWSGSLSLQAFFAGGFD